MRLKILVIFSLIISSSCNVTNKSASSIKMSDGYTFYTSPSIKIQLYGDYFFQPLKTKYFRDVDKRFLKYVTNKFNNTSPKLLYKAHTIIQPFYSTICLQYKTNYLDTTSLNDIKIQLKDNLNTKVSELQEIKCGSKDVYKIKYQATNSINKVYSSHTEYFFKNGEFVYRLFFWTTNSNDKVISDEAEVIIKNIRFD
jgi:hypothetical protein